MNAQIGPKIRKQLYGETLGHDVGELVYRGDMENANLSQSNLLTDEVDVDLDMLGTTMMDGVGGHIDNADIVAVDNRSQGNRDVRLLEELPQPAALGHNMGHSVILRLIIGAGHRSLALGGPGHQIVTEEDAEAGGREACVGVAYLVSVGVGGVLADGSSAQVKTGGEGALDVPENALDQRAR